MDTYRMSCRARSIHEFLLTADTLHIHGMDGGVFMRNAEQEFKALAQLWGFRLVPLTEQKEAA